MTTQEMIDEELFEVPPIEISASARATKPCGLCKSTGGTERYEIFCHGPSLRICEECDRALMASEGI